MSHLHRHRARCRRFLPVLLVLLLPVSAIPAGAEVPPGDLPPAVMPPADPPPPDHSSPVVVVPRASPSAREAGLAEELFRRLNDERRARGQHPLQWDPQLAQLAADWSRHMADTGRYEHRDLQAAVQQLPEYAGIGENIFQLLAAYESAGYAHRGWMRSTGHRNNLVNPGYDTAGIGVHCAPDGRMWATQNFGRYRRSPAPPLLYSDTPAAPIVHDDEGGPRCADLAAEAPPVTELLPELVRQTVAPAPPTWVTYTRAAGADRVQTAVEASRTLFARGAGTVVLARADDFADALAGAVLAGALGGPVLLVGRDRVASSVRAEIERLGPQRVYVLGGQSAVSDGALTGLPVAVRRLAGADRYATAAAVAAVVPNPTHGSATRHAYLANGLSGWPDAVAASAPAAFQRSPLLLATRDRVPPATRQAIAEQQVSRITLVGGAAVLGDGVAAELRTMGIEVDRLAGSSRYATAQLVREAAVAAGMTPATTLITTLRSWPDSLIVGAGAAAHGGLVVAVRGTDPQTEPSDAYAYAAGQGRAIERVSAVGGTAAISDPVMAAFFDHLRDSAHTEQRRRCLLIC
jgi:uncharacterized protein YkwD